MGHLENWFETLSQILPTLTALLGVLTALTAAVVQVAVSRAWRRFFGKNQQELEASRKIPETTEAREITAETQVQELPIGAIKGGREILIDSIAIAKIRTETAASISASLLQEYHAQGLSQSRVSFWFSIIFASIGFAIIAMSIGLFAQQQIGAPNAGWVETAAKPAFTLISGVVIEAVSALFFVQSNKTRELMTEFFDKLRSDRKLDESLQLMNNIPSEAISSRLKAVIALHFADVELDHESIKYLLVDGEKKRPTDKTKGGVQRNKVADDARSLTPVKPAPVSAAE